MFVDIQWTAKPQFTFYEGLLMTSHGFRFTLSLAGDVVAYRVTLTLGSTVLGPKDYPVADVVDPNDPTKGSIDLANDPDFPNLDGTYTVSIRAVDDAGNTSDPLEGSLDLDFVPPDAPTGFEAF